MKATKAIVNQTWEKACSIIKRSLHEKNGLSHYWKQELNWRIKQTRQYLHHNNFCSCMNSIIAASLSFSKHTLAKENICSIDVISKNKLEILLSIVATTRQNGTCSLLTSAKLSVGYLVVGITRELNKEPSLHCYLIYISYR